MIELSRRAVLAGAAACAAMGPFSSNSPAQAAAPAAGRQAPSFYRYKIGDYEITALSDGARHAKLTASPARNANLADVQAELAASFMPADTISVYFNPTLVNTGSKLVLIDAGNAVDRAPTTGKLAANLAAAGVDPKSIDIVLISHFHGDHIGGLRGKDGALTYPNAEIKVPAAEWAFWMDDGEMNRAPEARKPSFQLARRIFGPIADKVTKYESGREVGPGITSVETAGHTPGHTSFLIASGNGKLLVQGDVTSGHAPLFVRNPDWHPGGDMDPARGVATRRRLYDMLASDRIMLTGYHFAFPAVGHIEKDGKGYRMVPKPWNPII